jgi:hypothetical protein
MWRCKTVDALITILPLKKWQDLLIRRHSLKCPVCLGKLADKDEIRSVLITQSEIPVPKDLWPEFVSLRNQSLKPVEQPHRKAWNWGYAAAGALIVLVAVFWNLRIHQPLEPELSGDFQIKSIEVDGRPAQAYLFKTEDPHIYFVWAEKHNGGE